MSSRLYSAPFSGSGSFTDVETTIRNLTQDFCMAFNTGNYDQASALFAPDGVLMSPHQSPVSTNKLIERCLQNFAENGYQDMRFETLRVECSGDIAVEIGRYRFVVNRADGSRVTDEGKFLATWRRMGAWRILATSWSSNLPALTQQQNAA
jgi:uncharacterized protein (TIGR02246 family)